MCILYQTNIQVNRSSFSKVAPAKVPQQLCRGWETKDLRLWNRLQNVSSWPLLRALEIWVEAKGPNSIMIPCPQVLLFFPTRVSITMNDWHLGWVFGRFWWLAYCFRCSAIADPVVLLRYSDSILHVPSWRATSRGGVFIVTNAWNRNESCKHEMDITS